MSLPKGFRAARPDVVPVLKDARIMPWGWLVSFHGTPEELRVASVATHDTFENLGKTGVKTGDDGYGNKYVVQRRAEGRFDLEFYLSSWAPGAIDEAAKKLKPWKIYGAACEAIVAEALKRMRTKAVKS